MTRMSEDAVVSVSYRVAPAGKRAWTAALLVAVPLKVKDATNVALVLQVHVVPAVLTAEAVLVLAADERRDVCDVAGVVLTTQGLGLTRHIEPGQSDGRRAEERRIRHRGVQAQRRDVLVVDLRR